MSKDIEKLEIIDNPIEYKGDTFYPINFEPKGDFFELSRQLQRQIKRDGKEWNFEEFIKIAKVKNSKNSLYWSKNNRTIVIIGRHLFGFEFKNRSIHNEFYEVNKYNKINNY